MSRYSCAVVLSVIALTSIIGTNAEPTLKSTIDDVCLLARGITRGIKSTIENVRVRATIDPDFNSLFKDISVNLFGLSLYAGDQKTWVDLNSALVKLTATNALYTSFAIGSVYLVESICLKNQAQVEYRMERIEKLTQRYESIEQTWHRQHDLIKEFMESVDERGLYGPVLLGKVEALMSDLDVLLTDIYSEIDKIAHNERNAWLSLGTGGVGGIVGTTLIGGPIPLVMGATAGIVGAVYFFANVGPVEQCLHDLGILQNKAKMLYEEMKAIHYSLKWLKDM